MYHRPPAVPLPAANGPYTGYSHPAGKIHTPHHFSQSPEEASHPYVPLPEGLPLPLLKGTDSPFPPGHPEHKSFPLQGQGRRPPQAFSPLRICGERPHCRPVPTVPSERYPDPSPWSPPLLLPYSYKNPTGKALSSHPLPGLRPRSLSHCLLSPEALPFLILPGFAPAPAEGHPVFPSPPEYPC